MKNFKVFKRTANSFLQFAKARKTTIRKGLTQQEARAMCERMNAELTPAQRTRGTRYEYTSTN